MFVQLFYISCHSSTALQLLKLRIFLQHRIAVVRQNPINDDVDPQTFITDVPRLLTLWLPSIHKQPSLQSVIYFILFIYLVELPSPPPLLSHHKENRCYVTAPCPFSEGEPRHILFCPFMGSGASTEAPRRGILAMTRRRAGLWGYKTGGRGIPVNSGGLRTAGSRKPTGTRLTGNPGTREPKKPDFLLTFVEFLRSTPFPFICLRSEDPPSC